MTTFNRLQEYLMLTVGSAEAEAILKLAVQLVEEEREACAKIAETMDYGVTDFGPVPEVLPTKGVHFYGVTTINNRNKGTPDRIAAAIRCRE